MKVALVVEWLDSWRGGAETSTLQFLHHLMDRGVEVHVFTRSRPSPAPGLHVHTVSGASMVRTRSSITFAHRTDRMLRAGAYDIIHAISPCRSAHIYQPRGGTVAETIERNVALIRSASGRRLKRYANRFNFKQRYMLALERRLFAQTNGPLVVAISDYVKGQLERHYQMPQARIRTVFNGVDADRTTDGRRAGHREAIRREFGIADDHCLVLLVAHNFRLKGVPSWIRALSLLVKRGVTDIRSIVVGKGDSVRWYRLASAVGVADYLTFAGPSDRVSQFRHAADVLVHPTYYDPCSRVVLEAMAAGLPCVTTRWDGASEVIDAERNGFVLEDPGDISALATVVYRLRDASLRERIGRAAREVRERVSMARHTSEIMSIYEELLVPDGARG